MAGKLMGGTYLTDRLGGRPVLIVTGIGTVIFTLLFAISGSKSYAMMLFSWAANRMAQSCAWPALIKSISVWFDPSSHGRIVAAASTSYLFGDAVVRLLYGALLASGWTWEGIFYFGAVSMAIITIFASVGLRHRDPTSIGEQAIVGTSSNVYHSTSDKPESFRDLIFPLLKSLPFYLLLLMSIGLTFIRETLRDWIPLFLEEKTHLTQSQAALASTFYIIVGGFSTLLVGNLMDSKKFQSRKAWLMGIFLILLIIFLSILSIIQIIVGDEKINTVLALVLLCGIGMTLTGPYSMTAMISLEISGKKGASTVNSLNDAIGYAGAAFSGIATGTIATEMGWGFVFVLLTVFAAMTMVTMLVYNIFVERKRQKEIGFRIIDENSEKSEREDEDEIQLEENILHQTATIEDST
eukprot:TRINITY_DN3773_c0_g1_i2.p1 TRINITY_DN3773_c0_g1~~TRINITY_DN3773_c0_g1_i2.p1  ORF type:complete len:474 (-),score=140.23 TRINITY_DN3773_c0_g1_i2:18-1247(-)